MKPSHTPRKFTANKAFTDREGPKAIFLTAYRRRQAADEYRVLHWYGVGGQGKSALSREFLRLGDEARYPEDDARRGVARVNLQDPRLRQVEEALLSIRLQLGRAFGHQFCAFDTAFARYFMSTNPGIDIRARHPELFRGENRLLDDLVDWSEAGVEVVAAGASFVVPGLNLLYRYGARLGARTREWFDTRGKAVLADLDQLSPDELLERLSTYLGADLCYLLEKEQEARVTIILDTHENLWRGQMTTDQVEGERADRWVRMLVQDAPGCLFVVMGRDRLRWSEIDPDWEDVIETHLLGGLSRGDADLFLRRVPIDDEAVRTAIVSGAESLPFFLDLQIDLYTALREAGDTPMPDDFGGGHRAILRRFLDHVGERQRDVLRLLSYPARPTEALLSGLAEVFLGGAGTVNWSEVARLSVMEPSTDDALLMHTVMRDALQAREREERPDLFKRVHGHLLDRFSEMAKPELVGGITAGHETALLAMADHLLPASHEDWSAIASEAVAPFRAGERSATVEQFLNKLLENIDEQHWLTDTLSMRGIRALAIRLQGRYSEAEAEYRAVYEIQRRPDLLGEEHADTLVTKANLADVVGAQGRHAEAEMMLHAIYDVERRARVFGEAHLNMLAVRNNLAHQMAEQGKYASAEAEYREVYEIQRRSDVLGEEHPSTLNTRHNLAMAIADQGHHDKAEKELRSVYDIECRPDVLGEEHPGTLMTLRNAATQAGLQGRHAEAEAELRTVLELQRRPEVLGEEHPETLATYYDIAFQVGLQGRHAEAEKELRTIYNIVRSPDTLGEEHPYALITRMSLAVQIGKQGRHTEAEKELRAIYEIQRRADVLGEENPHTLITKMLLAVQIGEQGRHTEAEEALRAVYNVQRRPDVLGEEHPRTRETWENISAQVEAQSRNGETEA